MGRKVKMRSLALCLLLALTSGQDDGESVNFQSCSEFALDDTLRPGVTGEAVSSAVHAKLVSKLRVDDRGFIMNYAFVETEYGVKVFDRYEMTQQIWAITREQFDQTKEHFMKGEVEVVNLQFNIEWENIIYDELNIPLYSGLAFHLYLHAIGAYARPIPWGIDGQAELYAEISAQATIKWTTYMAKLVDLNNLLCTKQQADVVFLVDESGSIGASNFQKMMDFVSEIISSLNIGELHTRVALRTFSDPGKVTRDDIHFTLNDYDQDLEALSRQVSYSCDKCFTYTNMGISAVLDDVYLQSSGMRELSKKVLVVITDGESTEPLKTIVQSTRLHQDPRNIQVVAIGVGGANPTELNVIASSPEQVFFLDDFEAFEFVKDQITNSICTSPILSEGNGTLIVAQVQEGTAVGEAEGILAGNLDLVGHQNGIIPGYVNLQLDMKGRVVIDLKSSEAVEIYMSYNQTHPSSMNYDYYLPYNQGLANNGAGVEFKVVNGTEFFYISVYNYGTLASKLSVEILSWSVNAPNQPPMFVPVKCGNNAYCLNDGSCACYEGYTGNAYLGCQYDMCSDKVCDNGAICNPFNGQCECREGYAYENGVCVSPLCPVDPVYATENQYGYAMGYLSSPFYGMENYPTNFDCEYVVTAPRAPGSCYEVHIEHPFSLETSRSCRNDRLEIFDILNAGDISMDPDADPHTVVICGNACIADGGWIGRTCGTDLRLRFKSDSIISSTGWRVKWILRPKEDCDCWCNDTF